MSSYLGASRIEDSVEAGPCMTDALWLSKIEAIVDR